MRCVRVRSGPTSENPAFPDRTAPDRLYAKPVLAADPTPHIIETIRALDRGLRDVAPQNPI